MCTSVHYNSFLIIRTPICCVQMPGHRRGAGAAGLAEGAGEPHPLLHAGVRL